jgi:AcrR family transcriptional regulator
LKFTIHSVAYKTSRRQGGIAYSGVVPKLWSETIEAHRRDVRQAILDATWALVTEHGLSAVTMSQVAEKAGIGRATLYKYYPDVESILLAWHERQVTQRHAQLARIVDQADDPGARLERVLEEFAMICYRRQHHDAELIALMHRGEHIGRVQQQVRDLIRDLLVEVADTGEIRDDVAPEELATYCLHALTAASRLPSKAAVVRLVAVTLAGLRSPG